MELWVKRECKKLGGTSAMNNIKKIKLRGFNIAYHQSGGGEPMLMIHGITTYSFIWRKLIPELSKKFNVFAVDLLGCGDSEKPHGVDYSINAQADLISDFIDKMGLGPVHLVTHDIGGGIAQIMAVNTSRLLKSMTLINPVAYDYWPVQPITGMRIPIIREIGMALLDHGFFKILVKRGIYHKHIVDDELMELFYAPLKDKTGRYAFMQLAHSLNNRNLMDIEAKISKIELPTLLIRGDGDVYLTEEITARLHREIKNSRLIHIPTGGHYLQEDEPKLLVKYIDEFIKDKEDEERTRDQAA